MKTLCALLLAATLLTTTQAQLVLNGDFETLSDCPDAFDFDLTIQGSMMNWLAVQGTADGYHNSCDAIHPMNTPNIPPAEYGDGFAALWGPYEAFGCELTESMDPTKQYCLTFDGILTEVDQVAPILDSCAAICVYGSNTEPTEPGGFDIPVPIEEMEDMHYLGCSLPLLDTENWAQREITFTPDNTYTYLVFVSGQNSACYEESNYLALDNVELEQCSTTAIEESAIHTHLELYPNPSSGSLNLSVSSEVRQLVIRNALGQIVSEISCNTTSLLHHIQLGITGTYSISALDINGKPLQIMRAMVR